MAGVEGRVALVTGASQGIGRACALVLAEAGAKVALCARNQEKLEQLAEEIAGKGGEAAVFKMDVVKEDEIKAGVKAAIAHFGKIDILVNNAGVTRDQLVMRMKRADWDDVINTNLTAPFLLIQAVIGSMLKQRWGRIINVTSIFGQIGQVGQANYSSVEGGADWPDHVGGARGGFAQHHRQCRRARIHRNRHDRRTFPRTEREHPEEHSAGTWWDRSRRGARGEISGVGRSRLHHR